MLRVLILEDDEDIVDLIKSILGTNFEFITAENGLEGLQMVEAGEPDLIICDVMMPVMDGWEFMKTLRTRPGFEFTPVIFLSALSAQDQIRKGYSLGGALYLTKPINPVRLKRNIELFITDHGIEPRSKKKRVDQLHPVAREYPPFGEMPRIRAQSEEVPPPRPQVRTPIITPPPAGMGASASYTPPPPRPAPAPPAPEARPAEKNPSPPPPGPIRNEQVRIMIVEDDKDVCQMIQVGLGAERYELLFAHDGIEAIEKAIRYKPDMFIIDGMLPRMTGYQLTMMLRKNLEFFKSPIIFVSGKATLRDKEYARTLGINRFMAKPFAMSQLLDLLGQLISDPDFSVHQERAVIRYTTPEEFSHMEANRRKSIETKTLAEIEEQALAKRLKQQLS